MAALEVVGAAEAAQILGVEVPRISRWRDHGRMPPTVAQVRATPLWRVEDIEILKEHGEWKVSWTRSGRKPRTLDIAGLAEVAALTGLDKSLIRRMIDNGRFPAPALPKRKPGKAWRQAGDGLGSTPLWWMKDVRRWNDGDLPPEEVPAGSAAA